LIGLESLVSKLLFGDGAIGKLVVEYQKKILLAGKKIEDFETQFCVLYC
jgi:hypothetical protein